MNKGKWILGAVVAVLIGLLVFSVIAPNLGETGGNGAPVTRAPFEQLYEKEAVRSYVSCPVTGTEPLDAAMQKLVTEAAASFLLKAEEVEPGTEESLEIKYEVLEDGAEQYRIKFLTSAVHLGQIGQTLEREAEITFDRETGKMLAASDGVLPELPLPVSEPPVQPSADGNGKKRVAFTFDDGPTKYTPQLLDLLKERNIKITFFLQGQNISRYPETVKRAYAEGHLLGNHTYDHANLYKLDTAGVVKEISGTNEELRKPGAFFYQGRALRTRGRVKGTNRAILLSKEKGVLNMAKKNRAKSTGKTGRVAYRDLFWCPNEVEMRRENGTKRRKKSIDSVQDVVVGDAESDPAGGGSRPPDGERRPPGGEERGAISRIGENLGGFAPAYYESRASAARRGEEKNSSGVVEAGREHDEEEEEETLPPSQIKNMGSVTAKTPRGNIHCMTIIGQVEGHYILPPQNKTTKYEHIIPTLVAVEESPEIDGLLIMLNTVGGDVEAGLAIAEMISTMSKPTVSLVLGGGHSIGVPLAVSARRSFIVPTATMTIHPVRMNGLVVGVPQTMSYFDRMQERIIGFVSEQSEMPAKRMRELMFKTGELSADVGSVLSGEDAVREGLMDYLGGLADALDCLYEMIECREKKTLRRARKHC